MSVVALSSNVLDAGSSPAISTKPCKNPLKDGFFAFWKYSELNIRRVIATGTCICDVAFARI